MELADLLEIRRIEHLKYRYLRAVDLKLFDELPGLFAPEATASYGGGTTTLEGRDAIVEFLATRLASPDQLTSHKCHHPEITLSGGREATGVWALEDVVIRKDFGVTIRGAAYYDDRYVKTGDDWRILHTGYRRVYEEIQPRAEPTAGGPTLTAEWWTTGGRSTLGV